MLRWIRHQLFGQKADKRIDLRASSQVDEWQWAFSPTLRARIRRVQNPTTKRYAVAVSWPSRLNAREFYLECEDPKVAESETEIVVFEPGRGSRPYPDGPAKFAADESVDFLVARFNARSWSASVWPAELTKGKTAVIEYVGENPPTEFLTKLLTATLPRDVSGEAGSLAKEVQTFWATAPLIAA